MIAPARADTVDSMLPSALCAALADRERLRLFGTICREPEGVAAAGLALSSRGRKALDKLLAAGLVQRDGEVYVVRAETFLRRCLADEGLLQRDNHGSYWRPGRLCS